MSFVAKLCSNVVQNGLMKMAGNVAIQAGRQFHMMQRLFPRVAVDTTGVIKGSNIVDSVFPTSLSAGLQRMLVPVSPMLSQVAGFKVKGRLKRRCKDCYFVIRQQRHYVICPTHRRHKQMSMKKRDYKSWILTDATQSKVRPF